MTSNDRDEDKSKNRNMKIDRRQTLIGAALGAGVALTSGGATPSSPTADVKVAANATATPDDAATSEESLYERLGGIFAIAAVVNRFSDEIITNPKLNINPNLKAWNENEAAFRLPGLKFGRTQWVAALAGGPYEYTGLPLHEAHLEFQLTPEEFAEVGAEIVRALDYYQVPEREKQELVAAYMTAMPDVVDPAQ